jgi:hypothetical protein
MATKLPWHEVMFLRLLNILKQSDFVCNWLIEFHEPKSFITLKVDDFGYVMEDVPEKWQELFDDGLVPIAHTWQENAEKCLTS